MMHWIQISSSEYTFFLNGSFLFSYNVFFLLQLSQTGPENATENEWGVNYRALNDLFHISHNRGDTIMYEINVQMIEIYNEQIRDLLCSNGSEKKYPFPLHLLNSQTMSTLSTSGL